MKTRHLFAASMGIWLFLGLPVFFIASFWNGSFDPIPSAPPYLSGDDQSVSANLDWLIAIILTYLPLWIVPLIVARWLCIRRKTLPKK